MGDYAVFHFVFFFFFQIDLWKYRKGLRFEGEGGRTDGGGLSSLIKKFLARG